ncbi:hypothetical protein HanPI659440_Chr07g0254251 [Helianthus annuus]|nr:hypothetical protein HanPI659440_Chr07g0254251 [Helianthus annuus]
MCLELYASGIVVAGLVRAVFIESLCAFICLLVYGFLTRVAVAPMSDEPLI